MHLRLLWTGDFVYVRGQNHVFCTLFATFLLLFEEMFLIDVIALQLLRGHNQQQTTNNQTAINREAIGSQMQGMQMKVHKKFDN